MLTAAPVIAGHADAYSAAFPDEQGKQSISKQDNEVLLQQVSKLEDSIQKAINDRLYFNAAKSLEKLKTLVQQRGLTRQINQRAGQIETMLIDRLSKIKLVGPSEKFQLSKPEMPLWNVQVFDEFGPLPNFPLIARQGRQTLSERRTQNNGEATFNLRNVNFDHGPYTVTVEPNLHSQFVRASGLQDALVVSYNVSRSKCMIQLQCKEMANICNAVEGGLAKKGIFVGEKGNSPILTLETSARVRNSAGNLNTYDIDVILRGKQIYFTESTRGAGKNEIDAIIKSINKIDFSKLQEQIGNCNKQ